MLNNNVTAANMSELVRNAFVDCLFKEGESHKNRVEVEGLTNMFELHPERLEEKRELVAAMLDVLPKQFKEGYSFMNICLTEDCEQWTDEYCRGEQLAVMAIGLGLMSYCVHRGLWRLLPGGEACLIIR